MLTGCLSIVAACVLAETGMPARKFEELSQFERRVVRASILRPFPPLYWSWTLLDVGRGVAARQLVEKGTEDGVVDSLLGECDVTYSMNKHIYWRYPQYGFDVIFDRHEVAEIRDIPPRIPQDLPEDARKDMAALQGLWNKGAGRTFAEIEFDGDRMMVASAGVGVNFRYQLDPKQTPKRMCLWIPTTGTLRQACLYVEFGRDIPYSINGDELILGHKAGGDEDRLKRVRGPLY